jgi:hypothetical protein
LALDESSLQDAAANELARLRAFELGQPQNVADARQLLFLHPDESHRLIGIRYLSRGSYKGDVDDFVKALDDESPQVVEIAISMIGQRGSVSDLTIIEKFLGAENKHGHRIASLRAFASLGDSQHAALILSYAEPELRDLFRAWRSCMESLCGYTIGVALDLDLEQRRALVEQWRQYLGG